MSFGLRLAGDAVADLKELDVWLQEEVLDEVEQIVAEPSILRRRPEAGAIVYDFIRERGGRREYIFLTLDIDDARQQLIVLGISHHGRMIA